MVGATCSSDTIPAVDPQNSIPLHGASGRQQTPDHPSQAHPENPTPTNLLQNDANLSIPLCLNLLWLKMRAFSEAPGKRLGVSPSFYWPLAKKYIIHWFTFRGSTEWARAA